jgi:hypothetical protein
MANLTPEDYFELYGSKRPNSNIVQTYRIRKKTNNTPNYPGSLDHVVYLVLFEGKFLKKSELYAYTYLPEYYDLPESYNNKPGKIEISGVYKGVNLFIENPEVANSLGNCITSITVNGTQKPGGTGTTRVEIDFSYFDVKVGDDITIVINYDPSCKIDVINPEAVLGTKDDNVQTNVLTEKYQKQIESAEKKSVDDIKKLNVELEEVNLSIYKIEKKPDDQITEDEKAKLEQLKSRKDLIIKNISGSKTDLELTKKTIEKNKIEELNTTSTTIRQIERLVVAENLPINLTEVAIDKMGRNFDDLLLNAIKLRDLEVIEGDFYTAEDLTPVPNESVIERDKSFGAADEIVETILKNLKYMDSPADYEIIQSPWDPNDIPPETISEELDNFLPESELGKELWNGGAYYSNLEPAVIIKNKVRARGEYAVKVEQNSDKIKLIGLDGKFFLFPDGTRRELGELTLINKENPNDPNIIRMINEEYERQDELSDEYLEDEYVGEGLGTTLGTTLGDQTETEKISVTPGGSNLTPPGSFNLNRYGGPGYAPLKELIFSGESGNYDSMNPSTYYKTKFGVTCMSQTIAVVASKATGAIGRYQNMPAYILNRARSVGLDPNTALYNEANQELMGESLINAAVGSYIKGTNKGTRSDLENAVQLLAQTWASIPTIIRAFAVYNARGRIVAWKPDPANPVGNVETGAGTTGYYNDPGNNGGNIRGKNMGDVVIALIKTRKNVAPNSFGPTFYKPSYINFV